MHKLRITERLVISLKIIAERQ